MNYRITEISGWIIVYPSGKAENNEPLRVRYLFKKWLTEEGIKVIVNLKELSRLGVWEMGLLTSFKKEADQRGGKLRLCDLKPSLEGYFHKDRFAEYFEIYPDLEAAMEGRAPNGNQRNRR
jgi:anti-anti-sigma factor